jgi:hypothetical protein
MTVGTETGYGLEDRRIGVPDSTGSRVLFSARRLDGCWELFPRREAHHIAPTGAEVKKTWICTSTAPHKSCRSAYLLKQKSTLPLANKTVCY